MIRFSTENLDKYKRGRLDGKIRQTSRSLFYLSNFAHHFPYSCSLSQTRSLQYHGMHFAPYLDEKGYPFVGALIYDIKGDTTHFALERTNRDNRGRHTIGCDSIINDFCFTPDATLQGKL